MEEKELHPLVSKKKPPSKLSKSKTKGKKVNEFDNHLNRIEENIEVMQKEMKMTLQMIKDKKSDTMKDIDERKFRDTTLNQQKLDVMIN
jgi:hypothetical protein